MAIPVIDTTNSVLSYEVGETFFYQAAASGSPTSWAATHVPAGMTFSASTGLLSGAMDQPGVAVVRLTATNGDGPSTPQVLKIAIRRSGVSTSPGIPLDFDWITGLVSGVGGGGGEGYSDETQLFLSLGDSVLIDVGIHRDGVLQRMAISSVRLALKQYESERLIQETDGIFETVGSWSETRCRIQLPVDRAKWQGAVADGEGDDDTYIDAVAELQIGVTYLPPGASEPVVLTRTSRKFRVRIARDMASDV